MYQLPFVENSLKLKLVVVVLGHIFNRVYLSSASIDVNQVVTGGISHCHVLQDLLPGIAFCNLESEFSKHLTIHDAAPTTGHSGVGRITVAVFLCFSSDFQWVFLTKRMSFIWPVFYIQHERVLKMDNWTSRGRRQSNIRAAKEVKYH